MQYDFMLSLILLRNPSYRVNNKASLKTIYNDFINISIFHDGKK